MGLVAVLPDWPQDGQLTLTASETEGNGYGRIRFEGNEATRRQPWKCDRIDVDLGDDDGEMRDVSD